MPLTITKTDITTMAVDAIVNAANTDLRMGGGVCGAIFIVAGPAKLQEACNKLAPIKTGDAVITDGFNAKAKYIIHTAGPIYRSGNDQQAHQLYNCYYNSLELAAAKSLQTIAFPLISAGIYGYPLHDAITIAITSIKDFLREHNSDMTVYLTVLDDEIYETIMKVMESMV
ncbi:MAG: macro domain-containing protein [Bacteroidales bacterium]|nr:macro domain-containing protein [Bacteroidales bacterium]